MIFKVILTFFLLSMVSAFAATEYCGNLTSLSFETDIYTNIRMGLKNSDRVPSFVTVKDESSIERVIALVSGNESYVHNSDADDYRWYSKNDDNNYFVCVKGKELRKYRSKFYLDEVSSIKIWKNGNMF